MNAPAKPPMVSKPQPLRFDATEFLSLIGSGLFAERHIELIDGEIIELPPPSPLHGRLQLLIGSKLLAAVAGHALLWATGETAILFDDHMVRSCDAALVRGAAEDAALRPEQVALAIEISVSTIGRDLGEKAFAYAIAGVANLWVVDPQASVVHVFGRPEDGAYAERSIVRFGEPLAVPGTDSAITID